MWGLPYPAAADASPGGGIMSWSRRFTGYGGRMNGCFTRNFLPCAKQPGVPEGTVSPRRWKWCHRIGDDRMKGIIRLTVEPVKAQHGRSASLESLHLAWDIREQREVPCSSGWHGNEGQMKTKYKPGDLEQVVSVTAASWYKIVPVEQGKLGMADILAKWQWWGLSELRLKS